MSPTGTRRPRHPKTLIEAARRLFMIAIGRPGLTFDPSWLRGAEKTDELVAIASVIEKADLIHDLHVPQGWQLIPRLMEDRVREAIVRELHGTSTHPEAVPGGIYAAILATASSPEHSDPERMEPPATKAMAARRLRLARLFLEHSTHTYGDRAPNEIRTLLGLLDDAEAALDLDAAENA
ncbi:hypothetical protein OIU34_17925 [Pararhizobium sp. BT-229]|uniref:hypothetical protein n=1 Tax=Pararhizobium sp. BT-229 TaxID=2986923 RepID=UPI0021F6DDFF|nr:hypothetical protein [Pararhizobium sp. BT-229]MCV9963757.1 hypothetical protein [Pararhizobium sp. BT-229]